MSADIRSMRRLALPVALLVCVLPASATAHAGDTRLAVRTQAHINALPQLQSDVLKAMNALRRTKGLRPLRSNSALAGTALGHSISMAEHGFFGHADADGAPFWRRIKSVYGPAPEGFWSVGENIVWASPDLSAQQAIALWMHSAPHRKNLLSGLWRDAGVGAVQADAAPGVYGGLEVTILTVDFGVR